MRALGPLPWVAVALVVLGVAAEVGQAIRERRARKREGG